MVGNEVTVWLLSDTLLRDEQLRPGPTPGAVAAELQRRLGNEIAIEVRKSTDGKLDELTRVRRLDTWHVGWGLPRPSLVALQAGSCIVLSAAGAIDPVRLRELEAAGIGERTAEGYGQVCFNDPLLTKSPSRWSIFESDAGGERSSTNGVVPLVFAGEKGTRAFTYARLLETDLWKREISRAAQVLAADQHRCATVLAWKAGSKQGDPPMSQLGGLRAQLGSLCAAGDAEQILGWLHHLKANPRCADKWPDRALDRAEDLLRNRAKVWSVLDCTSWPTLTIGAKQVLQSELWPLAVRALFGACIRAHKRELEGHTDRREIEHGT